MGFIWSQEQRVKTQSRNAAGWRLDSWPGGMLGRRVVAQGAQEELLVCIRGTCKRMSKSKELRSLLEATTDHQGPPLGSGLLVPCASGSVCELLPGAAGPCCLWELWLDVPLLLCEAPA